MQLPITITITITGGIWPDYYYYYYYYSGILRSLLLLLLLLLHKSVITITITITISNSLTTLALTHCKEVKPNTVGVAGGCRVAEGGAITTWRMADHKP